MNTKAVKVVYMGKPLRDVYPHATRFQVIKYKFFRFLRWLGIKILWAAFCGAILSGVYFVGEANAKEITVVNQVTQPQTMAAVLQRIADCESGNGKPNTGTQFNAKGDVVTNVNANGTVDVGKWQINMSASHIKEMAKLGLNPLTEEGNEAYAKFLFENRGSGDWQSSEHCWMR